MRFFLLLSLAAWLSLAGPVLADSGSSGATSGDASDQSQPAPAPGPVLQPTNAAPVICDPGQAGYRYLEVRGTGFDAWADQHLVGNFVDGSGVPTIRWNSVWVTPQGGLTLEVNLCADPFQNHGALPPGSYTVSVGLGSGQPIAATSIALSPPAEPTDVPADQPAPAAGATNPDTTTTTSAVTPTRTPIPVPTALPLILPNIQAQPTPTALPTVALLVTPPTPTPAPRTGPGTRSQPFPLGAPGLLADGWQMFVAGVTADAYAGIKAAEPNPTPPGSDEHDYEVRVMATYQGTGSASFDGLRLALISNTTGQVYDQLHDNCGTIPNPIVPNLETAGGSDDGVVCFTVRISDIGSLVLFDNQTTSDTDRQYFALS